MQGRLHRVPYSLRVSQGTKRYSFDERSNESVLLENAMRFERYVSEFTFYDYNQPEDLPLQLKHCFHIIVSDPPYL
ncbi:unnamed protein product, partial [Eruca vesicaria subsp. sativa]|nr:unnamed protein product [Eruca vesicaria subsp. sativa]